MFILAMMTMIYCSYRRYYYYYSLFHILDLQAASGPLCGPQGTAALRLRGEGNGIGWYPHCQPIFQAQCKKIGKNYCLSNCDIDVLMWLNVFNHKCMQFGQLILRKIIKIVAIRCQLLRLKCTKFDFGWGSALDPDKGAYSARPDPIAGFKGPTSKGESEGDGNRGKGKREGKEKRRIREGRGNCANVLGG